MKFALAAQTPETEKRSVISLLSGSFAEMAEKAAAWGAAGLELMPVEPTLVAPAEILSHLQAHNLAVCAVGTALFSILEGLTLLTPDAQKAALAYERLWQAIDLAAALGAPVITVGGFRGRFSAIPNGRERFIEILRQIAPAADAQNVRLALEPMNRYQSDGISTVSECLTFLEEVNCSNVGVVIDICHMITEENSWSEPFRMAMATGKLYHVHAADSNRMAPGMGLADFSAVLTTLVELGYSGYITLEILAKPDPDLAARQGLNYLKKLLEGIR